jgi:hypothetical protein
MTLRRFFFLLMCLSFFSACRHDLHDTTPFVPIDECTPSRDSVIQYFSFKEGTYWIYQEQTSGDLDSIYVYESLDTIYQNGLNEFWCYTFSTHDQFSYTYYYQSIDDFESWIHPPCIRKRIWAAKFRPGDYVGAGDIFFYPFTADEIIGNYSWHEGNARFGKTTISDIMTNYVVGQDTLDRVVRFHVAVDNVNFDNESTYDIAKNIGFVRKTRHLEDSTYEQWKLIRWHVVQ